MKEEDFMKKINESTKDIPIPDSISPENMKKMLDESIRNNPQTSNQNTSRQLHFARRFAAVACIALVCIGAIGVSQINQRSKTATNADFENVAVTDDAASDFNMEFAADEDCGATANDSEAKETTNSFTNDSPFFTPNDYEEYYHAIANKRTEFYDQFAKVDNPATLHSTKGYRGEIYDTDDVVEESYDASSDYEEAVVSDEASATADNEVSNNKYSATNTQEKNVDEGDIVKTDGSYIYQVMPKYDELGNYETDQIVITKANQGNLAVASHILLSGILDNRMQGDANIYDLYIHNESLILLITVNDYTNEKTKSYIAVYDIKDRAKPIRKALLSQSGMYDTSRIYDGYLYTVSSFYTNETAPIDDYTAYIPYINDEPIECKHLCYTENTMTYSSRVVTALDLNNPSKFTDSTSIPIHEGDIYMSENAIYFYSNVYDTIRKTEFIKVNVNKGSFTIGSSATVAGQLYGPFAVNEYDGYLRIITTIPASNFIQFSDDVLRANDIRRESFLDQDVSVLYVLDSQLKLTGKIVGIAPGERIQSARFMNEIGYFVTYKNTDPLFSVDLSDPYHPTILGELKIPGFSAYLHPYADHLLLGIGEERDPETQAFLGIKLSMFDTSDPTDLKEIDKMVLSDTSYSDALSNYKAVMIDPEKNILGFQVYGNAGFEYYLTFSYDEQTGFSQTAKYDISSSFVYYNSARGLYIDDYIYIITDATITSYPLHKNKPIEQIYLN